jgi:hypothetical protein
MAAEKLRDLSRPIDVPLLDATVAAFYGTGSSEEVTAPPLNPFNAADVTRLLWGWGVWLAGLRGLIAGSGRYRVLGCEGRMIRWACFFFCPCLVVIAPQRDPPSTHIR